MGEKLKKYFIHILMDVWKCQIIAVTIELLQTVNVNLNWILIMSIIEMQFAVIFPKLRTPLGQSI